MLFLIPPIGYESKGHLWFETTIIHSIGPQREFCESHDQSLLQRRHLCRRLRYANSRHATHILTITVQYRAIYRACLNRHQAKKRVLSAIAKRWLMLRAAWPAKACMRAARRRPSRHQPFPEYGILLCATSSNTVPCLRKCAAACCEL